MLAKSFIEFSERGRPLLVQDLTGYALVTFLRNTTLSYHQRTPGLPKLPTPVQQGCAALEIWDAPDSQARAIAS